MPVYEYECSKCSQRFELRQGFHDKPQAKCPVCKQTARRVFHPTPIIFKGSGFYITDHRPSGKDTGTESGKEKPEASKSSK
ncbi:MAG: FmdB family transcriptional regulator [Chloroflexi bacterium RBG_16_50_9]|nr:MAG: FmdB family transcriptional regulator [Chloroflexi bacterium RBG_16_50_9]